MADVDKDDINRIRKRIDKIQDEHVEIRGQFYETIQAVNNNLTALNTKMDMNDTKTSDLCRKVNGLVKENQQRKHDIELHEAECPARVKGNDGYVKRGVLTVKRHPIISAGGLGGILAAAVKIIEWLVT